MQEKAINLCNFPKIYLQTLWSVMSLFIGNLVNYGGILKFTKKITQLPPYVTSTVYVADLRGNYFGHTYPLSFIVIALI